MATPEINRRQFLKFVGLSGAAMLAPELVFRESDFNDFERGYVSLSQEEMKEAVRQEATSLVPYDRRDESTLDSQHILEVEFETPNSGDLYMDVGITGQEVREMRVFDLNFLGEELLLPISSGLNSRESQFQLGDVGAGKHRLSFLKNQDSGSGFLPGDVTLSLYQREGSDLLSAFRACSPYVLPRWDNLSCLRNDLPFALGGSISQNSQGDYLFIYNLYMTDEDGGESPDARMARYGRTLDVEPCVLVKISKSLEMQKVIYQAKGHKFHEFLGRYQGRHPVVAISTQNNMFAPVLDLSESKKFAFVPETFDLNEIVRDPFYRQISEEDSQGLLDCIDS